MAEMELSTALSESIRNDSADTLADILEVGVDSFLDDGVIKDFPFLSTIVGIYKVGKNVNELYLIKKLKTFLCAINADTATEEEKNKRRATIQDNSKKRSQELEHLLLLINRYIGNEKPALLAKFYLVYIDGSISWEHLAVCAEIIDRLLPGDYALLASASEIQIQNDVGMENALRLIALGLLKEKDLVYANDSLILNCSIADDNQSDESIRNYQRTKLGEQFVSIIRN